MHQCTFCGSAIPDYGSFCGQCGRDSGEAIEARTMVSNLQMSDIQDMDTATRASISGFPPPDWANKQLSFEGEMPTAIMSREEDEEERRRRAAILGLSVPLLGSMAIGSDQNAESVAMVQGTPQFGGIPTVQGMPQSPTGSEGPGLYSSPTGMAPQIPSYAPVTPLPPSIGTFHHPPEPYFPPEPHHQPQGCNLAFIITAISIVVLVILSFLGLGFTVFAPSLSLSGSTNVVQGGTFTLHGNHFVPGSSVALVMDFNVPLYFSSRGVPVQTVYTADTAMQILRMDTPQTKQSPLLNNIVSVGRDGTFAVTITANPGWLIGEHTIKASETLTHRSADLVFTIYPSGTIPTPSLTGTPVTAFPTANTNPSPTSGGLTPTAATTLPGLSCVNPSSLSLGSVIQGYNKPVTAQLALCTTGAGIVSWTATWDQKAAPWLKLDQTSGQITAPGQAKINASALAGNLVPGNYSVTLTFISQPDNTTKSLLVSFTVQGGCVTGKPNTLSYSGVSGLTDPAAQVVSITNCGPSGTWSASALTNDGANWLSVSPTANSLQPKASNNVTITASNLKAKLAAGTYTGTVTFKMVSATFSVSVTLTVLAAPTLSVAPASVACTLLLRNYICTPVTLSNSSTTLSLNWAARSSFIGAIISPASGTLAAGKTAPVTVTLPLKDCLTKTAGTLTFTGPTNTVIVTLSC